jgi:hypothetical protein
MQAPAQLHVQANESSSNRPWAGVFNWILTHRLSRLIVPPLMLAVLVVSLITPLLIDLGKLSDDDLVLVHQDQSSGDHDGNLIVNIKNINPNNGIATLDVTYVTDDISKEDVELWIASGGVSLVNGKLTYDVDTELHRLPVVMDSPTVFVWGETKRATYKELNADIKIDQRSPGYLYPFDRYEIEFSFVVIDKTQKTRHPKLWFELEDPRFVHSAPRQWVTHGDNAVVVPTSLAVVLDRPMYQMIFLGLSMLMGLGCVLWTLYKITYTSVDGMESLSLLAFDLTVLLAVPGLRGVFVPSNIQFAPLFDFFIVLIWTAGLLALVINVVRHDILIGLRKGSPTDCRSGQGLAVVSGDANGFESAGSVSRRQAA